MPEHTIKLSLDTASEDLRTALIHLADATLEAREKTGETDLTRASARLLQLVEGSLKAA